LESYEINTVAPESTIPGIVIGAFVDEE